MRGAVTAGMCLVLEAAGLWPPSTASTAARRARSPARSRPRARRRCGPRASRTARAARSSIGRARCGAGRCSTSTSSSTTSSPGAGRSPRPAWLTAPTSRAVAVSATRAELRVLRDFESAADLLGAVRASCAIPVLTGAPPTYRGEPMVDGGLLEPIPYRTALREGATHVLVLRSREASYRARRQDRLVEPDARPRPSRARAAAAAAAAGATTATPLELERLAGDRRCSRSCSQIAVPVRQPPGAPVQHRPRPHRRRHPPRRARDGLRPLRRARHAVLAAVPRAARRRRRRLVPVSSGWPEAPPLGHAALDHVDHLARARAQDEARRRPRRAGPSRTRPRSGAPGRGRRAARRCRARP